jgi:ParB family chromosome partitioning protein
LETIMAHPTIALDLTAATLRISPRNARKAGPGDLTDLAASIVSIGLIHPLKVLVLAEPDGKITHEIVAGGRRFAAIRQAIKAKALPKSFAIRCEVVTDADADEVSLAENVVRAQMHPADAHLAYKNLIDRGLERCRRRRQVRRQREPRHLTDEARQRRARDPGRLPRRCHRPGDRCCICPDRRPHPAAGAVRGEPEGPCPAGEGGAAGRAGAGHRSPRGAGGARCLSRGRRRADPRPAVRPGEHATIADVALLDRLVAARLDEHRQAVAAEGWKWSEVAGDGFDHGQFPERVYPKPLALSEADAAERAQLDSRYDDLYERHMADPEDPALAAELEAVSEAIDGLDDKMQGYAAEDMARAGAVILIGYDGTPRIERGCVRKEDVRARPKAVVAPADEGAAAETGPKLGDTLTAELSAVRTGIIAATLADNPRVALASVVHALAATLVCPFGRGDSALDIRCTDTRPEAGVGGPACSSAFAALDAARERWADTLPGEADALFGWCLGQDTATLLDLLAFCAALTVNAKVEKHERHTTDRHRAADALAEALDVSPGDWTSLGRLGVFERTTKAFTLDIVQRELGQSRADNLRGLKKGPLAEAATRDLDGTWLPEPIRRTTRDDGSDIAWPEPMAEAAE